jgi:signal transduction histidine kinase
LKKRILFFLIIPFLVILVSIFYLNKFNRKQITAKFEEITTAEGVTIRNLVEISGLHLAEEGNGKLTAFLDRLYDNESIIYLGLFKNDELVYLLSRFEGYFPVVPGQKDYRILDTPMGKIFEITGQFADVSDASGTSARYRLHIGFDYEFLSAFESTAGRNFLIIAVLLSFVLLAIIALIIYFDKKFFRKELELMEEKQEKERFKELSLLTSEIAHEIKNPLNSIYLSFNTLEKYCSADKDAVFYRDAIKGEIKRISGILQSYSDLSKEIRPEIRAIDPAEFSREFNLLMAEELKKRGIDFKIETGEGRYFRTDKNLLKQILLNLVKNSMEADASAIFVGLKPGDNCLVLEVADNGKGIDEKLVPSIFKPYISTRAKGMGLGLHVTLRLVQALHGEIRLVSHAPGNTVFRVTLPLKE